MKISSTPLPVLANATSKLLWTNKTIDDSFASKGKSTMASSYNFELERPIVANLQKAMTTVDEEGSKFFYSEDLEENYISLD